MTRAIRYAAGLQRKDGVPELIFAFQSNDMDLHGAKSTDEIARFQAVCELLNSQPDLKVNAKAEFIHAEDGKVIICSAPPTNVDLDEYVERIEVLIASSGSP